MSNKMPFEECYNCDSWIGSFGCTSPDTCNLIADKVTEREYDTMHDDLDDEYFEYGDDE